MILDSVQVLFLLNWSWPFSFHTSLLTRSCSNLFTYGPTPKPGPAPMKIPLKPVGQNIPSFSQSIGVNEVFSAASYLLAHSLLWSTSTTYESLLENAPKVPSLFRSISFYSHFPNHNLRQGGKRSQSDNCKATNNTVLTHSVNSPQQV